MFLIVEGEGELRFGDQRYPIRQHDVIACPTGGREVVHLIISTGKVEMRYLAMSNVGEIEACEYPDPDKIMIGSCRRGQPGLWKMFRAEHSVEYHDRESNEPPQRDG